MGKLTHSAATSLDGFIAGPGGDMSWLGQVRVTEVPTRVDLWLRVPPTT